MITENDPKDADDIVSSYFENYSVDDLDLEAPHNLFERTGLDIEDGRIVGFDSVDNLQWDTAETLSQTTEVGSATFHAQARIQGTLSIETLDNLLSTTPYTRGEDSELLVTASHELTFRVPGRVELGSQDFEQLGPIELEGV
jgi:hypothetical protein